MALVTVCCARHASGCAWGTAVWSHASSAHVAGLGLVGGREALRGGRSRQGELVSHLDLSPASEKSAAVHQICVPSPHISCPSCHLSAPQAAKASGQAASTEYAWELHAAGLAGTEPRPRERAAQRAGEATQIRDIIDIQVLTCFCGVCTRRRGDQPSLIPHTASGHFQIGIRASECARTGAFDGGLRRSAGRNARCFQEARTPGQRAQARESRGR